MSKRERGITDRERLVVIGISALYTGTQDPTIQEFVQKSREAIADGYVEADEEIPTATLETIILDLVGRDPIKRKEIHIRALSHAKGVLVGQKKSPQRDEHLRIISERLSELSPAPTK